MPIKGHGAAPAAQKQTYPKAFSALIAIYLMLSALAQKKHHHLKHHNTLHTP